MAQNYDVKQEWEKTKKQLIRFGHEVGELVRKGEDEIITLSQKGKMQIEVTTTTLKKEKLYYLIGKEYVKLNDTSKSSPALKKLLEQYHKLEREQKSISSKLKRKSTKKSARKSTAAPARKTAKRAATAKKTRKRAAKQIAKGS
ncbi:MAG: hypothetical protein KC900_03475 [Candidatus Omnitrophica bacterium]|nr:hypothetical protein [Candidatus Omnitrophota bacterium]